MASVMSTGRFLVYFMHLKPANREFQFRVSSELPVIRATELVGDTFLCPSLFRDKNADDGGCQSKLVSTIVSSFTASYIFHWPEFFPEKPLEPSHLPTFDGRAVVYPTAGILRDYLSWRQVDCQFSY